jgi:hypothetical protein
MMSDQLLALLAPLGLATSAFPQNSRYNGVPISGYTSPSGQPVAFVSRRVLPQPGSLSTLQVITVGNSDRLDRLAAQYLGDPLVYWRICDANGALRPDELTETPGQQLRITLPAGIAGPGSG